MYRILAELLVGVHLAYIAFVVVGLALILLGTALRWSWIRNPWFRCIHLAMILIVALEAMIEFECPLTTWERELRVAAGQDPTFGSFSIWLMRLVLHPEWATENTLFVGSLIIAGLILATFLLAPPRFRRRKTIVAPPASAQDQPAHETASN